MPLQFGRRDIEASGSEVGQATRKLGNTKKELRTEGMGRFLPTSDP